MVCLFLCAVLIQSNHIYISNTETFGHKEDIEEVTIAEKKRKKTLNVYCLIVLQRVCFTHILFSVDVVNFRYSYTITCIRYRVMPNKA